tara:strand:- start:309 stop:503 length:195 start_codon:yes stop_codon:yes gene_type:complete
MSEKLYDPSGNDITEKVKKAHKEQDTGVTKVKVKNPNPVIKIPVQKYKKPKGRDWGEASQRTGP